MTLQGQVLGAGRQARSMMSNGRGFMDSLKKRPKQTEKNLAEAVAALKKSVEDLQKVMRKPTLTVVPRETNGREQVFKLIK